MEFTKVLAKTRKWEGGFVNDSVDRGGATKYGITIGTLREVRNDPGLTTDDVRNLTEHEAEEIYETLYYKKPKIDRMPDMLQPVLFDMAVNHGPGRAIRILQTVINNAGVVRVEEDGAVGPLTIGAAEQTYEKMGHYMINAICDERQAFYELIVRRNPDQKRFLAGWTNRNNDFRVKRN